jgi:hypothetical protein
MYLLPYLLYEVKGGIRVDRGGCLELSMASVQGLLEETEKASGNVVRWL